MKKVLFTLSVLAIMAIFGSCLTMGSSGNMLNNVNALSYTDDPTDLDFAKKIWNGPVKVVSEIQDTKYLASCDINNINAVTIYIPYNLKGDPEYSAEVATILSYYAEIYRQVQAKETISVEKAILHMKNSYNLILNNYLIGNKHTPNNPRQFKELIDGLEGCDVNDSVYYFNGRATIENDIVVKYTLN